MAGTEMRTKTPHGVDPHSSWLYHEERRDCYHGENEGRAWVNEPTEEVARRHYLTPLLYYVPT